MLGLHQFESFDFARFCQGKRFVVTASKEWTDRNNNNQHLGTVVTVAIAEDKTLYAPGKDGKAISNLYEKMNWKVARDVNFPIGTQVIPVDGDATVYGEYRNQLSVRVSDIKAVQSSPHTPASVGKALN